eukprot:63408-Chlamydomonas_euryale.AAC.3
MLVRRDDVGHYSVRVLHKAGLRGATDEYLQATDGPFWLIYYHASKTQSLNSLPYGRLGSKRRGRAVGGAGRMAAVGVSKAQPLLAFPSTPPARNNNNLSKLAVAFRPPRRSAPHRAPSSAGVILAALQQLRRARLFAGSPTSPRTVSAASSTATGKSDSALR